MIITLSAWPGAGKTAFANALARSREAAVVYVGEPLKTLAYELFPHVREAVNAGGWECAKEIEAVRKSLQDLGHQLARNFGPDYLMRGAEPQIRRLRNQGRLVVIADARHPEELHYFDLPESYTIRIERPNIPTPTHPRERQLDDARFDRWIHNTGTLEDLERAALETFDQFARQVAALR